MYRIAVSPFLVVGLILLAAPEVALAADMRDERAPISDPAPLEHSGSDPGPAHVYTRPRADEELWAGPPAPRKAQRRPSLDSTASLRKAVVILHRKPKYHIAVQFARTADDDGGRASTLTRDQAEAALARLNEIWARNGGDIQFHVHPASNFDQLIRSTLLNRDCVMPPGTTATTIAQETERDLNGDGVPADDADKDLLCEKTSHTIARNAYGMARGDRIVVISRGGNDYVDYDTDAGHWVLKQRTGGASSHRSYYIRMPGSFGGSTLLAHETGHYLHAGHTFGVQPRSIASARELMEKWAADHPGDDPANAFDRDTRIDNAVHDTPPDPSHSLFKAVHGDHCALDKPSVVVDDVMVDGMPRSVTLTPDRTNIMSYFKGCGTLLHRLSRDQWKQIHEALTVENRRDLVARRSSCYATGWKPWLPVDTEGKLAALLRRIVACKLRYKEPLPWEIVEQDIYVNPATLVRLPHGFRRQGGLGVHVARERALIEATAAATMVE